MKSGLAFFVFAMRALRELDIPVSKRVVLQLNADEEVGSHTSRALTENAAERSDVVLVLEPGTGLEGKLKTARKGVGTLSSSGAWQGFPCGSRFRGGRERDRGAGASDRAHRRI